MEYKNPYLIHLAVPGFIALFAANFVSDFPYIRDSQLPFVYFILSLLSLAPPLLIAGACVSMMRHSISLKEVLRAPFFILGAVVFSLLVGLSIGVLHNKNVIPSALRAVLGKENVPIYSHNELVRELFSRMDSTLFIDGRFSEDEGGGILPKSRFGQFSNRYARISLQGSDLNYEGKVIAFHSGADRPQVWLSPACRIGPNGDLNIVEGPGVWLSLEDVSFVEILEDVCSPCATRHEEIVGRVGGKNCPYKP